MRKEKNKTNIEKNFFQEVFSTLYSKTSKLIVGGIFFVFLFVFSNFSFGAERGDIFVGGMYGGGWYNKEGDDDSSYVAGLIGDFYLSEPLSLEGILCYMPVWGDDYYFVLFGIRYDFLRIDFFMTPSIGVEGGILVPVGEKNDIDGVMSMSAMLMYKTKWGFELGPQVLGSVVFEGPHTSVWVNYSGVIRVQF